MTDIKDKKELIEEIISYAKKCGADNVDVLEINSISKDVSVRNGKFEEVEKSSSGDIGLRVAIGKKKSIISSSDFCKDNIKGFVQKAVDIARLSKEDPFFSLADKEMSPANIRGDLELFDTQEVSDDQLLENAMQAEDTARKVKGITNSEGAGSSQSKNEIIYANSNGFYGSYKSSSFSLAVSVIAKSEKGMERDGEYRTERFFTDLPDPKKLGEIAANRTIKKLNPQKAKSGKMPVVFDPRVSKSFVGYLSSAVNGNSISRGSSFLTGSLHKQVFRTGVNIVNDPFLIRGHASKPFDAEGVEGQKMNVIQDGVLENYILDINSANKLKMLSNGSAARSVGSNPYPTNSNMFLDNGNVSSQELVEDISSGVYITDTFGMGINLVTGDYSQGASGFMINNGQITYPISEITIAGNLRDIFLEMIPANDLQFLYSINCPTIRVDCLTIGGK